MIPRLLPLYFDPGRDGDFDQRLAQLRTLLAGQAEFLPPVALGTTPLPECEAVFFPQLLGEAYRRVADFRAIDRPILVITSEFGTLSMWDWEIITYLRAEGVETVAPYQVEQTQKLCRALGVRRELAATKFLVYQDNPGEGFQAPIFKRFYWWEEECTRRIHDKFGLVIDRRSFRELGARAKAIPDEQAAEAWRRRQVPVDGLAGRPLLSAMKIYLAVKQDMDADPAIRAVGINCLNESHFSDTTPCLAWNLLYQEQKCLWGCEADTLAMLSEYLLYHSLGTPLMMTNLYPFVLGQAALKHEKIADFPAVPAHPENHILVAHCGYMGLIPQAFSSEWMLRSKVLAIVDDNATAIDARMPEGPVTLAKIDPTLKVMSAAEGELTGYAQFPGSDCRNGGVVRVRDGRHFMDRLVSHHYLILTGHAAAEIRLIAQVLGLTVEEL